MDRFILLTRVKKNTSWMAEGRINIQGGFFKRHYSDMGGGVFLSK